MSLCFSIYLVSAVILIFVYFKFIAKKNICFGFIYNTMFKHQYQKKSLHDVVWQNFFNVKKYFSIWNSAEAVKPILNVVIWLIGHFWTHTYWRRYNLKVVILLPLHSFLGNLQKFIKDGCEINYIIYLNHFYSHKNWIICTFSDLKKCILCNFDCSKILDDICYNYELNWVKYSVWCHYSKFLLNWGSVHTAVEFHCELQKIL